MNDISFHPIIEGGPKVNDFVHLENYMDMVPGHRLLGRVERNPSCPDNLMAHGIGTCANWEYTEFCIGLNGQTGGKRHLWDFTLLGDWGGNNIWLARYNPHD